MEKNISTLDLQNAEQQKAFDLVANTNNSLFITGKAGTGKTTFIKRIQEEINKNFLVLAPTGIAAIAVGGQTMHSFFGFPMQAIGPHTNTMLSYESKCILEETDTIIVDEVSMVRCDLVDGMDRCLRMVFKTNMPLVENKSYLLATCSNYLLLSSPIALMPKCSKTFMVLALHSFTRLLY